MRSAEYIPTTEDLAAVIAAIGQLGSAVVLAVGVAVAYWQLKAGREAHSKSRRSELAEEMIVITRQIEDSFRFMRNPFDSIPEDKARDREFVYQKRYERVKGNDGLFERFREYQVRLDSILGEQLTEPHVRELLNFRVDIAIAIEDLIGVARRPSDDHEMTKESMRTLYGSWSDRDVFGQKVLAEINTIVCKVSPYARFEG